jgi:hypothetical protein
MSLTQSSRQLSASIYWVSRKTHRALCIQLLVS